MKKTSTLRRSALTLDAVVDFLRGWLKSILDDVTNLIMGMVIIAGCATGILYLVAYQDEIIVSLVTSVLQASPDISANQALAVIGASIYILLAVTISLIFSVVGFHEHRDDALDRIDELMSYIEESELDEETARELIGLLHQARIP
jgi:RsiW-degrading membrane proteinase PrsW (M82 family)